MLFAGGTVIVAILGLTFTGIPFISGMGVAAALTVAAMVAAALTLLPALLGLLGRRVNQFHVLRRRPTGNASSEAGWGRWARFVDSQRWLCALGALAVLLLVAAPALALRLGTPDDGNNPESWTQRRAYDLISSGFGPGYNGPLLVVLEEADDRVVQELSADLRQDQAVSQVAPAQRSEDGAVVLITLIPRKAPQHEDVSALVHRLREEVLVDRGVAAYIGGPTAYMIDLADTVAARLPWVVGAVVVAGSLLLMLMFRAPLVALKAAVMALLSIGAAFGVLVAIFQWGWGLSLLGIAEPVPIMSVVPMLLFAVLFGLTMDYEVFLLSAIRQEYERGADAHTAIRIGLARTGRVITAAAAIMAVVFISFVGINDTLVQMVGVGLATAVIVDATIIRMLLGPALMSILGESAWWPKRSRS